jgi:hypothetical protein
MNELSVYKPKYEYLVHMYDGDGFKIPEEIIEEFRMTIKTEKIFNVDGHDYASNNIKKIERLLVKPKFSENDYYRDLMKNTKPIPKHMIEELRRKAKNLNKTNNDTR